MNLKNDSVNIEKVIEILNIKTETKPYVKLSSSDIRAENLSFKYADNDTFLLKDISFTVKSGEHLAIAGESGSGKSTILKKSNLTS